MQVFLDTTWVRPFRDSTVLVHLRYDYARPQDGRRVAEFRLRERDALPADFRFQRLETFEYNHCGPERRMTALLEAAFFDAAGRELSRLRVDTSDPRGFPIISGDSAGATICGLRTEGQLPVGGA